MRLILHLTCDSRFVKVPALVAVKFQWPFVFYFVFLFCYFEKTCDIIISCVPADLHNCSLFTCLSMNNFLFTSNNHFFDWVCFVVLFFSFCLFTFKIRPQRNIIINGITSQTGDFAFFLFQNPAANVKSRLVLAGNVRGSLNLVPWWAFSVTGEYIKDPHGRDNLKSNGKFLPD